MKRVLPHIIIILSCMLLVFFCIDRVNTMMNFINNEMTKWIMAADCVAAITLSVIVICDSFKKKKRRAHQRPVRREAAEAVQSADAAKDNMPEA